jgi:nitric oxide synthase-interacting protein
VQQGLAVKISSGGQAARVVGREGGKIMLEEEIKDGGAKGRKRKFEFDESELLRIADADRAKARRILDEEREASKTGNGSFWLPSQIGNTSNTVEKKTRGDTKKLQPLCPGSTERTPHPISLKTMTAVSFSKEVGSEDLDVTQSSSTKAAVDASAARIAPTRTCPSCSRALSNASKAVLLKPCGHVLCGSCVDKFMLSEAQAEHAWNGEDAEDGQNTQVLCFVCGVDCTPSTKVGNIKGKKRGKKSEGGNVEEDDEKERGLFDVASEGTGFAGGGLAVVKRADVVFQC